MEKKPQNRTIKLEVEVSILNMTVCLMWQPPVLVNRGGTSSHQSTVHLLKLVKCVRAIIFLQINSYEISPKCV